MINTLFFGCYQLESIPRVFHTFTWTFLGGSDEYKQAYFLLGYRSSFLTHISTKWSQYHDNIYVKKFRCYEQYLFMTFSQLTYRESLRNIDVCLCAHENKISHMGISSSSVTRITLSRVNERRDWWSMWILPNLWFVPYAPL